MKNNLQEYIWILYYLEHVIWIMYRETGENDSDRGREETDRDRDLREYFSLGE